VTIQTVRQTSRARLALLTVVALIGAADVAQFAAVEPGIAFKTSGRAAGTVFGLAVWAGLTLVAGRRWRGVDNSRLSRAALGLSALAAIDGVGLAVVHIAVKAGGLRPLLGATLGVASLGLAVSARSKS
jgi:hypothetical protein